MAEDLVAWIDALGEDLVCRVGRDWGGVIAYAAGALTPERFHGIATPAGRHADRMQREGIRKFPRQLRNSW
jgi:pimeloyl-ACP methyl ester carboxylesterase